MAVGITSQIDRLGVLGSSLCAFHCAFCAFLPGLFILLGLEVFLSPQIEWVFAGLAIFTAVGACVAGYKHHHEKGIVVLFAIGISLLLTSRGMEEMFHGQHDEKVEISPGSQKGVTNTPVYHEPQSILGVFQESFTDLWLALIGVFGGIFIIIAHLWSLKARACCDQKCVVNASHSTAREG